ncbi:MAG: GMC family oxidoreductase N-terminal domain-containing protein [Pseudomonadota bacterium]
METAEYDFVIVGAGSAGCVLANRLSENPAIKVLLVEAGGSDNRFWIKTPLGYAFTFSDRNVNWCYSGEPDPGLNGRIAYFPRGKVLGGSSSINAMAYVRGLPHDFDDWHLSGALGWHWTAVRAAFEAMETQLGPDGKQQGEGSGPVIVSDLQKHMHPFSRHFLSAAREMGWPVLQHMNGGATEGLAFMRSTVSRGRRWSSADAFLRPVSRRPNLRIVKNAHVEKLVTNGKRVSGLHYSKGGQRIAVDVSQEVILSAGAINSPKILQLSGIGDHALLSRHGICTAHHLPEVGKGLQDHLALTIYFKSNEPTLNNALGNKLGQMAAGLQYLFNRTGPLAVPVNHCSGFVRMRPDASRPDLQVYCNPASYNVNAGQAEIDSTPGYLLCAQPSRPTSRGSVTIASSDPVEAPLIQPNSLVTEEDQRAAVSAGRMLQKLARTPTLKRVTKACYTESFDSFDDEALLTHFRNTAGSVFHASCTCRMGADASNSVLDNRLKVHGLAGLRVVDASAFPNITSGNTNAPTMMLATMASDMILEDLASCARSAVA